MADSQYIIVDVQNQQQRRIKLHDNGVETFSITTYKEVGDSEGDILKRDDLLYVLKTGFKFGSARHLMWNYDENGDDGYGFTSFTLSPTTL